MEASGGPRPQKSQSQSKPEPEQSQQAGPEQQSQGGGELSEEAGNVRIQSYEQELREAHSHPETDDEGNVTNVADVMERYNKAREDRVKD